MRVLITGASGFVAQHLVGSLERAGVSDVLLTSKLSGDRPHPSHIEHLDVTDRSEVDAKIDAFKPHHVVHLAAIAAPTAASADSGSAWRVNLGGTLNLASSIIALAPKCTLHSIGTALVYGSTAKTSAQLDETALLAPIEDYAATKAAADLALGALLHRGLKCIRYRPFNHTGPGQDETFVVPSFAMQIARIEAGLQAPVIQVGNLDATRDLLDVRDVTEAYALGVARSESIAAGTVLNISSGEGHRMRDVLEHLLMLSRIRIKIEADAARMRPSDVQRMVGDSTLARRLLGWRPKYSLANTLADVLDYCRKRVEISSTQGFSPAPAPRYN